MQMSTKHGFAFLSNTKCASTSLESLLEGMCNINMSGHSLIKHMNAQVFNEFILPAHQKLLPRCKIESFCLMREPFGWLESWYRYRCREELKDKNNPNHRNYAGNLSFDEFVQEYLKPADRAPCACLPTQSEFILLGDGSQGVDYVFDSARIDLVIDFLSEKVGRKIKLGRENVSPKMPLSLSQSNRERLQEHFKSDLLLYSAVKEKGCLGKSDMGLA